jgi:hypothetical protein
MEQPFEQDLMEDLADESPLSSAEETFDEQAGMEAEDFAGEDALSDEMPGFDTGVEEELLAEDGAEDGFEADVGDDFAEDYAEDYEAANPLDAMEEAIADALDADDSDEFLRRLSRGIRTATSIARRVGRGVGQVARVVGPIASAIPLPQAQLIGRVANVAGRLLADGADEFTALDEMLAFAEDEHAVDAAAPVIAGLTIRTIMPRAARLNRTTRRQLVRSVSQSTRALARRQGPQAMRAVPRVVQAVQRTAQRHRMPVQQLPQAMRRAVARVASNPNLVRRLARSPSRTTSTTRQLRVRTGVGAPQRIVISGPVEITIRSR